MEDSLLDPEVVRNRLRQLSSSQTSIQTMSMWITHHHASCEQITKIWAEEVCTHKAKSDWYLAMLYLANDVVQNAKKDRHAKLVEAFFSALKTAITHFGRHKDKLGEKGMQSTARVINILGERKIYKSHQVQQLRVAFESATREIEDTKLFKEVVRGEAGRTRATPRESREGRRRWNPTAGQPPSADSATRQQHIATYPEAIADPKNVCPTNPHEAKQLLVKTREAHSIVVAYAGKVKQEKQDIRDVRHDLSRLESLLKLEAKMDTELLHKANSYMTLLREKQEALAKEKELLLERRTSAADLVEEFDLGDL
ncbi:Regulation of nuclear pre-mRNA domain-containing protein 1B [Aphelenchoides fujianensis]|nr:Regulation of nuclear pre-mRNA domain-containing protein 1B [Aphelenchoides fujianensis]